MRLRSGGRLRTFLLASLNSFLANEWDRGQAQKRGGGVENISLDCVHEQEQEHRSMNLGHNLTPERIYEKRWAEAVLSSVLTRLQKEFDGAKVKRFDVLKPFLTEEKGTSSHATAALELGLTEQRVQSAVHRLRQRWRELMREEIMQTLNAVTGAEVDDEIRHLISVLD